MNCKMLFLKRAKLSELLLLNYRGWEERVLKKSMFYIKLRTVVDIISCSMCCPSDGDFIKQILMRLTFSYLKEIAKFSKPPPLL